MGSIADVGEDRGGRSVVADGDEVGIGHGLTHDPVERRTAGTILGSTHVGTWFGLHTPSDHRT